MIHVIQLKPTWIKPILFMLIRFSISSIKHFSTEEIGFDIVSFVE